MSPKQHGVVHWVRHDQQLLRTGFRPNEAFSALRVQSYKDFLRFRIGPDGSLAIEALGLDHPGGEPELVDELVLPGV